MHLRQEGMRKRGTELARRRTHRGEVERAYVQRGTARRPRTAAAHSASALESRAARDQHADLLARSSTP